MPSVITGGGWVDLPDGRRVRVLAYEDGSVTFRLHGTRSAYALTRAYLEFNPANADPVRGGQVIVKVKPLE